jgi:hypothetical protein
MGVPYDVFAGAFLAKISEYSFLSLAEEDRTEMVDGFMKRALSAFRKNCKYDLFTTGNDTTRTFSVDIPEADLTEIADIVSEGMVSQWLKPYVNKQENLENVLNTKDFTTYSPAELLMRVGNAYAKVQKDYTNMIREYSYNHGDLSDLHL